MANRRDRIVGVPVDAERNINEATGDLDARLRKLEQKPGRAGVVTTDTAAKVGEFLSVEAPSAGLTIIFPEAVPANRNGRVTLSFRNANPVRLVCISGQVNRQSYVVNTAVGTFEAICDGELGWSVETGLSSTGSAVDAQYVLGAAHGSLPNGRVATDSTEIDAVLTTPNVVSWVLRDGSVALGRLVPIADDTFLGNISGASASPSAITFTSFAGDGLSYDASNHQWDIVGSTSITVTSDQVQRAALTGAISASANANSTLFSGVAANTSLIASRGFLNFIAGTHTTVSGTTNATDILIAYSVDLSTLVPAIDSTSVVANGTTLERAALTGAIAASQNSNATLFSGIRDNGSAETDRTNLNFVSSTSATAVVTDDAANDELEITFQRAALTGAISASANANSTTFSGIAANTSLIAARGFLNFIAGTNTTVTGTTNVNDILISINVDDYPLSGLADQAANTIVANATGLSAAPTAVAVSADSVLARVGGNLVSHPWSTMAG